MKKIFILTMIILTSWFLGSGSGEAQMPAYDVAVKNIRFLYGVGKGPTSTPPDTLASAYYRGYGMGGTMIELTAEMNVNGQWKPLYGAVNFTVQFTDGATTGTFNVAVQSGQNRGTAVIPYDDSSGFDDAWIASGSTAPWDYTVTAASGNYVNSLISHPSVIADSARILWDRQDPPDDTDALPFPPASSSEITVNTTTTSFKLSWNPVDTSAGSYNQDFYEYRIYYRAEGETSWRIWNGSNDSTLRGTENNPASPPVDDPVTHFSGGLKYTTIPNLQIFTRYEYYLAAVDVFGNETAPPAAPYALRTQPYSVSIVISDGINSYMNFNDLANTSLRTLRESNIKVEIFVVSSVTEPDTIKIWFTRNDITTDIVASDNTINQSAFAENTLFSVEAKKSGPNKWVAYLSTQTPVIRDGNSVRFIVESGFTGTSVYSDVDLSDEDPNDDEWTFYVGARTVFKPWPVRILNNVITPKNPVAYPSYYLSDDARVTIRVYDVKGRAVTTIVDNSFRRGGQNIKDRGWRGTNKARKYLGVGLYYVHIKAKRVSDGRVILNKFKKVIIAR